MVNGKQRKRTALSWEGLAFPVYPLQRRRRDFPGRAAADFTAFRNSLQSRLKATLKHVAAEAVPTKAQRSRRVLWTPSLGAIDTKENRYERNIRPARYRGLCRAAPVGHAHGHQRRVARLWQRIAPLAGTLSRAPPHGIRLWHLHYGAATEQYRGRLDGHFVRRQRFPRPGARPGGDAWRQRRYDADRAGDVVRYLGGGARADTAGLCHPSPYGRCAL